MAASTSTAPGGGGGTGVTARSIALQKAAVPDGNNEFRPLPFISRLYTSAVGKLFCHKVGTSHLS